MNHSRKYHHSLSLGAILLFTATYFALITRAFLFLIPSRDFYDFKKSLLKESYDVSFIEAAVFIAFIALVWIILLLTIKKEEDYLKGTEGRILYYWWRKRFHVSKIAALFGFLLLLFTFFLALGSYL
jgi:hypothetical protein